MQEIYLHNRYENLSENGVIYSERDAWWSTKFTLFVVVLGLNLLHTEEVVMNIFEQLLYSGGGFLVGVATTITYARAAGNHLRWPWHKANHQADSNGVESKIR